MPQYCVSFLKSTFLQKKQEDVPDIMIIELIFFCSSKTFIFLFLFFILLFLARYKGYIVNPSGNIFVQSA